MFSLCFFADMLMFLIRHATPFAAALLIISFAALMMMPRKSAADADARYYVARDDADAPC